MNLGPLTAFIGPNGSGKSNLLGSLRFLSLVAKEDLPGAVEEFGGFGRVLRNGARTKPEATVSITVDAVVTDHASDGAPDSYHLEVGDAQDALVRNETFQFKRQGGRGRRITVQGENIFNSDDGGVDDTSELQVSSSALTGLYNLQRIALGSRDNEAIASFAEFLTGLHVFDPDPRALRRRVRVNGGDAVPMLASDGGNLAAVLLALYEHEPDAIARINRDLRACLPGLETVTVTKEGGDATYAVAGLRESGVTGVIDLAEASFGTVRMLSLLTLLHHPSPPPVIAIEEIDGGLHPYALDVLARVLREASERTQILVATHSPTFVNRLKPNEVVLCDRDAETGESLIPAIGTDELKDALARHPGLGLGELWFTGIIGGVPDDGGQ